MIPPSIQITGNLEKDIRITTADFIYETLLPLVNSEITGRDYDFEEDCKTYLSVYDVNQISWKDKLFIRVFNWREYIKIMEYEFRTWERNGENPYDEYLNKPSLHTTFRQLSDYDQTFLDF